MTIQFKEGDKVRVLAKFSRALNAVDTSVPYIVEDVDDNSLGVRGIKSRRYHSILVKDIEPWRDEPPTLTEQLAAKRQERETKRTVYTNMTRLADAAACAIEVLDEEIHALESQLAAENAQTRLAEIEAQKAALVEEEARLRALITPKIEVGAIVEFEIRGEKVRRIVTCDAGTTVCVNGDGWQFARELRLIFPANHPVAQSLASRKDGEWREGDAVRIGDIAHFRHGDTVTLGKERGVSFVQYEIADEDGGFFAPKYHGYGAKLVTPRELRVDIGDASGGEWVRWFAADKDEEVAA